MILVKRVACLFLVYVTLVFAPVLNAQDLNTEEIFVDRAPEFDLDAYEPYTDDPDLLLAQNDVRNAADDEEVTLGNKRDLRGFAGANWEASYTDIRAGIKALATSATSDERVEIVSESRNKFLLVKRNDILYRYNFYKAPIEIARLNNHEITEAEHDEMEALLFQVRVIIPYIEGRRIKNKLMGVYGRNSRTTYDEEKMTGADIWELDGGHIVQWYEPYQSVPYTRHIDYYSAAMVRKILEEYSNYFDAPEKLLLEKLVVE